MKIRNTIGKKISDVAALIALFLILLGFGFYLFLGSQEIFPLFLLAGSQFFFLAMFISFVIYPNLSPEQKRGGILSMERSSQFWQQFPKWTGIPQLAPSKYDIDEAKKMLTWFPWSLRTRILVFILVYISFTVLLLGAVLTSFDSTFLVDNPWFLLLSLAVLLFIFPVGLFVYSIYRIKTQYRGQWFRLSFWHTWFYANLAFVAVFLAAALLTGDLQKLFDQPKPLNAYVQKISDPDGVYVANATQDVWRTCEFLVNDLYSYKLAVEFKPNEVITLPYSTFYSLEVAYDPNAEAPKTLYIGCAVNGELRAGTYDLTAAPQIPRNDLP